MVDEREVGEDIVQEALLRAFRFLPSLREGDRFGPWLNTIVRRLCQQWLRDGSRRPEPVDGAMLRGAPVVLWGSEPKPPGEVVERVRAALAILSQRERRVMILHYLEGLSCEEIARWLGIRNASVRRILHYSRRKVRKEAEMAQQAETAKRGPRELTVWIDGDMRGAKSPTMFDYILWTLAQSICLAVNKGAKTVPQIAGQVEAHEWYVQQMVGRLVEMSLLHSPKPDHYATTFIAFDADDWRQLDALVNEPAGAATQRLAAALPALRETFEKTPLAASGWRWESVIWPIYALLTCNRGFWRHLPTEYRPALPERPDGGRYRVGGVEDTPGLREVWTNGLSSNFIPGLGYGWYTHPDVHREGWSYFTDTDRGRVVEVLAEGARTEDEVLTRLQGEPERWRGALAELVEQTLVARDNGAYRLDFPVFRQADNDVLIPVVDSVVRPIAEEIAIPAFADLDARLDQMGYGHLQDQYIEWHGWLSGAVMGQAVHFLLEQGVLPQPPDPAPMNFCMIAWEEGLPLIGYMIGS
jgi:RNA polymerase sigma-70 factor (ECF subfamily)